MRDPYQRVIKALAKPCGVLRFQTRLEMGQGEDTRWNLSPFLREKPGPSGPGGIADRASARCSCSSDALTERGIALNPISPREAKDRLYDPPRFVLNPWACLLTDLV